VDIVKMDSYFYAKSMLIIGKTKGYNIILIRENKREIDQKVMINQILRVNSQGADR
jgi:hypothetical protein